MIARSPPRFGRRAVLLGGVAASLWTWRGAAGAATTPLQLTAAPAAAPFFLLKIPPIAPPTAAAPPTTAAPVSARKVPSRKNESVCTV